MAKGVLAIQVDAGDIEDNYGVFPNLRAARDFLLEKEEAEYDKYPETKAEYWEEQRDAFLEELEPHLDSEDVDLRFGSPFISMELVFLTVEVRL